MVTNIVVKALTNALPVEEEYRAGFLWDHFANKPEESRFKREASQGWRQRYELFSSALVHAADDAHYNALSLSNVLQTIKPISNGCAYLPVGAYVTSLTQRPVWIVVVKWDYERPRPEERTNQMIHFRAYAFDQGNLEQVGFVTCK